MRLTVFLCLAAGIARAQPETRQDPATLELARSIYTRAFTDLRLAKTLEDMKKLSDVLDSPDWISVDRMGRTILTKRTPIRNSNRSSRSLRSAA